MRTLTTAAIAAALILTPSAALATPGHDPVTVCHKPGTPAEHEITVDRDALDKHLEHGDALGPCEVVTVPTEPTPDPDPTPTPEPTEEPTSTPTDPETVVPSPAPVVPAPTPSVEPTPVPSPPNTPAVEQPAPAPSASSPSTTSTPATTSPAPAPSVPASSASGASPTSRSELAVTGPREVLGLLSYAIALLAAGALAVVIARGRTR